MADFISGNEKGPRDESDTEQEPKCELVPEIKEMINLSKKAKVIYCPTCTMPIEFCEYGASFDKCFPWIAKKHPEVLSEELIASKLETMTLGEKGPADEDEKDGKKKKHKGAAALKKAEIKETKVVIARVQRQKRKFVTVVAGLDTVENLKLKDATKTFGKKFSSGASVNETQQGKKEVVIQGDVSFDLPDVLIKEFKVAPSAIFFFENGVLRPYD